MDLGRAITRFNNTPVQQWDPSTEDWIETEYCGSLQVFDRFITEREFGQKKRIMLLDKDQKMDSDITTVRLQGSEETFLVEKFNEDVRFGKVYSYAYLLHEAPYYVEVCKIVKRELASGAVVSDGEQVLEKVWVDISRFSGTPSKTFEETEITILSLTFPSDSVVTTDCYLKLLDGTRYNVDEIYYSLDLIAAKGKRIGL